MKNKFVGGWFFAAAVAMTCLFGNSNAQAQPAGPDSVAALPPDIAPGTPLAEVVKLVQSGMDADVIKTYVELGMGIGIIASMAFNSAKDTDLRLLQGDHLFEANTTYIALRHGHYLRSFAYRFIELCSPALDEATVRAGLALHAS